MNRNVKKIVDETKIPESRMLTAKDMSAIYSLAEGTPFRLIDYGFVVGFNSGRSYEKNKNKIDTNQQ
ncbi:MAG: hypothetical protein IKE94_16700 [Aeriscardovia sp.]|nr:hypothetical protein [Aeriscardovia sp.]MBR2756063.1 hypothetical protein [Lachnospiraceae bacterium]